ncbi:DUF2793 domain-containing protein [Camelimonas abortus]|uniref:DUF2793 domain-containing protein n=1 Tax=Camelimonas abortus TaxID=1017184 RepID=A0ABV7LFD2_9HYPH
MSETPRLRLPLVAAGQAQKHVTVNESLTLLDDLAQLAVRDADRVAPPAAPGEGDRHIVAAGAAGDWAGQDGAVAVRRDGAWQFHAPAPGWVALDLSAHRLLAFDGVEWRPAQAAPPASLDRLGIGTGADPLNPLSVRADNVLFSARDVIAGGGDLRLKANRQAPAGTVSHLFQSGWSGRAEFGLIGDDDFVLKVSPDGATWREALRVDAATAAVRFPAQGGAVPFSHGGCRLVLDGAALRLLPWNGGGLLVDGALRPVPAAGVALAADGLAADATWFIYAAWSGGAMSLVASAAAPVADAASGVMVATGDPALTLVGMARTVSGPAWSDAPQQRLVRSWFSRPATVAAGALAADVTVPAGPPAPVDGAVALAMLAWAGECVRVTAAGSCLAAGATGAAFAIVAGSATLARQVASLAAGATWSPALAGVAEAAAHGLMTFSCVAGADAASLTWAGADGAGAGGLPLRCLQLHQRRVRALRRQRGDRRDSARQLRRRRGGRAESRRAPHPGRRHPHRARRRRQLRRLDFLLPLTPGGAAALP